jgi:protein SCO1
MIGWLWVAVSGCQPAAEVYPVHGRVVELRPPDQVVIAHQDIPGFMDAMTMPFRVEDPGLLAEVDVGEGVSGELVITRSGSVLRALRVTEPQPDAPKEAPPALQPGEPVPVGALFPATEVPLAHGPSATLGVGQQGSWAVTFFYTRCPLPEYCPLILSRLSALQGALPAQARLLAITLDPQNDTRSALREFAVTQGAVPGRWDFGRVPEEVLVGLAEKAGLKTAGGGKVGVVHDLILVVLGPDGRLIARYNDMNWDQAEVVSLLARE